MEDDARKILLISDNQKVQQHVEDNLLLGYELKVFIETSMMIDDSLSMIGEKDFDIIIYGMNLGPKEYMEGLDKIMLLRPDIPVIIVLATTTKYLAAEAMKKGAREFIIPDTGEDVKLRTAVRYLSRIRDLQRSLENAKNRLDRLEETIDPEEEKGPPSEKNIENNEVMTGMEYSRMLSSGLSSDMNKELVLMRSYIDSMKRSENTDERITGGIRKISASIKNLDRIMEQLLLFSGRKELKAGEIDINEILADVVRNIEMGDSDRIEINMNLDDPSPPIKGDGSAVEKVFKNIIYNSLESIEGGGRIDITMKENPKKGNELLEVRISDTGSGIAKENIKKVFQPFFTTKASSSNPGLGLSISYGIMKKMEGDINIISEKGEGTTVSLLFPKLTIPQKRKSASPTYRGDLRGNGERILLLEDREVLLALASKTLAENGYIVFMTKEPQEARKLFRMEKGRFDLLLIDLFLEKDDPISLVDDLYKIRDGVPVKFIVSDAERRPPTVIARKSFSMIRAPLKPHGLLLSIKNTIRGVKEKKRKDEELIDFLDSF